MKKVGTYVVRDDATGAFYIGSTGDFTRRRNNHNSLLRRGEHFNSTLQQTFTSVDQLSWDFTPTADRDTAYVIEEKLLAEHADNPLLCNTLSKVKGGVGRELGYKHTEESIAKMSEVKRGKEFSDEHRAAMSASRIGKPKTAEWSDKIAEARRIRIVVDGVSYRSATEAAAAHNTSVATVMHRVRNTGGNFDNWHFATE